MLTVLGRGSRLCDGVTRRELLRVGGLSLFGGLTCRGCCGRATARRRGRSSRGQARSVIMFNLLGGPSQSTCST